MDNITQDEAGTLYRVLQGFVREGKNLVDPEVKPESALHQLQGGLVMAERILGEMEAKRKAFKESPPRMTRREFPDSPNSNGEVIVHFVNAAHLVDTINYARQHGLEDALGRQIMRLITMAAGSAQPKNAWVWDEGGPDETRYNALPGHEVRMIISPDGFNDPGFGWHESMKLDGEWKTMMNGGLIFHYSAADWSIHT